MINYRNIELKLYELINQMRENPQMLIPSLNKIKSYYNEKEYRNPNLNFFVTMKETNEAVDEVIAFLENQIPLFPLNKNQDMIKASEIQVKEILNINDMKQIKAIHLEPLNSIIPEKYKNFGIYTQNFGFTYIDPELILCHMLIDDGNTNRGNRKNLFRKQFTDIGISVQSHEKLKCCYVFTFYGKLYDSIELIDSLDIEVDWPKDAIEAVKDFSINQINDQVNVVIRYTFTLNNGQKIIQKVEKIIHKDEFLGQIINQNYFRNFPQIKS